MQNALQKDRTDDVTFSRLYNLKLFKEIAKDSGSVALEKETEYLNRAKFFAGRDFHSEVLNDGDGFYAGTFGKTQFRLIEIAVRKSAQGKGYGTIMMKRLIRILRKRNIEKITLRTSRKETAVNFYRRFGGQVVGIKGDDYEMEILVCFTS